MKDRAWVSRALARQPRALCPLAALPYSDTAPAGASSSRWPTDQPGPRADLIAPTAAMVSFCSAFT